MTGPVSRILGAPALALTLAFSASAPAAVTISTDTTQNLVCSGGVCSPTAADAVLNVNDLEGYLASGNVEVTTTGSGVEANDIDITSGFSWSSSSALSLVSHHSISVDATVSVNGLAGLLMKTGHGRANIDLTFANGGSIIFANLASTLSINRNTYALVGDISTLATDIRKNPSGSFALAAPYDAAGDGTYSHPPVGGTFVGSFEGLGNTISNLSIDDGGSDEAVGLFSALGSGGTIRDVDLSNAVVESELSGPQYLGGLAGENNGTIIGSNVEGEVTSPYGGDEVYIGGLVGDNLGIIAASQTSGSVEVGAVGNIMVVGGLSGENEGKIKESASNANVGANVEGYQLQAYAGGLNGQDFGLTEDSSASGSVSVGDAWVAGGLDGTSNWLIRSSATGAVSGKSSDLGGLVGSGGVVTSKCYATGAINGGDFATVGGLFGSADGRISESFSEGTLTGATSSTVGGVAGANSAIVTNSYSVSSISAPDGSYVGGFSGDNSGSATSSYNAGSIRARRAVYAGGFAGTDSSAHGFRDAYWDKSLTHLHHATGNRGNEPGVKALTTQQLQSELPRGFDPKIWAQSSTINNGFPYLINNPPP